MHPMVSTNASLGFRYPREILDVCLLDLGAAFRHALSWKQNVYLHVEVKRSTQIELQQQQITYDQTCTYDCSVGFFTFCTCPVSIEQECQNLQAQILQDHHAVSCIVAKEVGCSATAVLTPASVAVKVQLMT